MALVQWTSSSGGDWGTATNWSGGALPGSGDDVEIATQNITVTISSSTFQAKSLTTNYSTLSVDGGTLSVSGTAALLGAFIESSGVLLLDGQTTFGTTASQTGGSLSVSGGLTAVNGFTESGGIFDIGGTDMFQAALTQSAGLIAFSGNRMIAQSGFTQTGGTMTLVGTSQFYGSLSQTGNGLIYEQGGLLTDYGSFSENTSFGGGLALIGGAVFDSTMSIIGGTVSGLTGAIIGNDGLSISAGVLNLSGNGGSFYGTVNQTGGYIDLYSGSFRSYGAFIENGGLFQLGDLGGTFNNLSLLGGTMTSTAATISVSGTYAQTGGTLVSGGRDIVLSGPFSEGTGSTIDVRSGALQLFGSGTIGGTVTGAGRILVNGGTTTIASTAVLSLAGIQVFQGTLVFAAATTTKQYFTLSPQGQLATNGHNVNLSGGASLDGEIVGASIVSINDGGLLNGVSVDGTSKLYINSTVDQTGGISLGNVSGSRSQLNIGSGGHLRITGNYGIFDGSQSAVLNNAGQLIKTAGSGVSTINANVVSSGLIGINSGTLLFDGPSNNFGGTISGTGTFAIGNGQNTFSSALTLANVRFIMEAGSEQLNLTHSLAYGGEWSQFGGTLWLNGAVSVTTAGETGLDGGLVTGSGVFSAAQSAAVNISGIDFEGTSTLKVAGTVAQTSSVGFGAQIGSAPNLIIASTATWIIENNASLGGQLNSLTQQNAIITNDGLIEKLNGNFTSNIVGDFINAGTLDVANNQILLNGSGTLGGTLTGAGSLTLSGNYLLASGLATSIGQIDTIAGTVTLGGNLTDTATWAQTGGVVSLAGDTLTLSGLASLEGGFLTGPGTLTASGPTYLGDNYTIGQGTMVVAGHALQLGDIAIGDYAATGGPPPAGSLPASVATLDIAAGATYTLAESTNISSNGTLGVAGTFVAQGAGLSIIGPSVVDTGVIEDNSAALRFIGPVSGSGSIVIGVGGSLDFQGSVSASTTVSFNSASGSMFIEDPLPGTNNLTFDAQVAGFRAGDFIELSNISTNLSQDTLALNAAGTIATITDLSGDSDSITFTSAQTLSSLSLGFGPHGDITLFHS